MSGDVQPRKRRDKKKKKDDDEGSAARVVPPRAPSVTPLDNDDVTIHVQKDSHTGGGICAKLVFFFLLSALAVLIGLIITEHRGLTDLDTIERESKFTQYFEGWVDNTPDDHDDHHGVAEDHDDHDEDAHEEHDDEHDEHDEHDEDDHDEAGSEEEVAASEEEEEVAASEEEEEVAASEEEEEESVPEYTQEEEDEDDIEEGTEEATEEATEETYEQEEDQDEEEEDEPSQEATEEESIQEGTQEESAQDDDEDEEADASEAPKTEEDQDEDDQASKEDDDQDVSNEEPEDEELPSKEDVDQEASKEDADAPSKEDTKPEEDDDQEDAEPKSEENADEADQPETAEGDDVNNEQPISVVKAGVGLVILVVAYVVLIRKWKSDEAAEDVLIKTKSEETVQVPHDRRNTIVVPPSVEEVENYDDYSGEEDEDYDEEYEEEDEYEIRFDQQEKKEYQKLRNTYERSLTPDSDRFEREDEPDDGDEELEEGEEVYEIRDEDEEPIEDLEPEELEPEEEDPEEEIEGDYDPECEDEEEEAAEPDEPISEEDDEELLKKLEAKYGKLATESGSSPQQTGEDNYGEEEVIDPEYDNELYPDEEGDEEEDDGFPWRHQGKVEEVVLEVLPQEQQEVEQSAPSYDNANITNEDDLVIFDQLDQAQENLNVNAAAALAQFAAILKAHPRSPRAIYGRARALDHLAEQRQSNQLLTDAITNYMALLSLPGVPPALFKMAADRCINRLRFMGQYPKAVEVHRKLIARFPDEIIYRNQLAVTYLTNNRMEEARRELRQTLDRWPSNGFALAHYGFILKVHDSNLESGIDFLRRGIATREEGVVDGRFYFHLGDALARLGRHEEAAEVYEDGARQKVFLSARQRSLYNVPTLKAQPWWSLHETPTSYRQFFNTLERNWIAIRDEGLAVMNSRGLFQDEAENLKDKGEWKQFELFARGNKHRRNCERCPLTCKLVATLPEAVGCRRGQVKFSVMLPGTHVWPHCGPTNCRLRAHLGLKVPDRTYIRVDEEIRSWEEGEIILFDDSFEHEVWHKGDDFRLVLIVDVWHPELTAAERRSLPTI